MIVLSTHNDLVLAIFGWNTQRTNVKQLVFNNNQTFELKYSVLFPHDLMSNISGYIDSMAFIIHMSISTGCHYIRIANLFSNSDGLMLEENERLTKKDKDDEPNFCPPI